MSYDNIEQTSITTIQDYFTDNLQSCAPKMEWAHGVLWVDSDDESEVNTITSILENDVLAPGLTTETNCLKATTTEPWDQWAIDIVGSPYTQ